MTTLKPRRRILVMVCLPAYFHPTNSPSQEYLSGYEVFVQFTVAGTALAYLDSILCTKYTITIY